MTRALGAMAIVGRTLASAGATKSLLNAGARLVVMNAQETPFDRVAAAVIPEQLGTVLPELVALV